LVNGTLMPQNAAASAKWVQKAAMQGVATAQDDLALMYQKGVGVPKDAAAATTWAKRAAAQGQGHAQYMLGGFYASGSSVPKDAVEAYKWMYMATIYPSIDDRTRLQAATDLDRLAGSMTKDQIHKAMAEAKGWKPVFEVP